MTRTASGFTLTEVVVALSVGGLVTLLAHTTVNHTLDLAERTQQRLASAQHAAGVRRQLTDWLAGAIIWSSDRREVEFIGEDAADDSTRSDQLRFTSTGVPGREPTKIRVYVDDHLQTREQGLVAALQSGSAPVRVVELAAGVTDLDVRYLFEVNHELQWFLGWNSSIELPLAVEIRLLGADLPPLLELPITVVIGGST